MSLEITTSLALKIGFASHQNSVAILQDLTLHNKGLKVMTDLVVILTHL